MHIFTQHNDAVIRFHAAPHHIGDHIDELAFFLFALKGSLLFCAYVFQLGEVAAYANITKIRTGPELRRSEEHTSELQSLMRISYAVFCLKKKTKRMNPKHKKS